jgi:hypothetical protein
MMKTMGQAWRTCREPRRIAFPKHRMGAFDRRCSRRSAVSAGRWALRPSARFCFHRHFLLLSCSNPRWDVPPRLRLCPSSCQAGIGYCFSNGRIAALLVPHLRRCAGLGLNGSDRGSCIARPEKRKSPAEIGRGALQREPSAQVASRTRAATTEHFRFRQGCQKCQQYLN